MLRRDVVLHGSLPSFASLLLMALSGMSACSMATDRAGCTRDRQCIGEGEVCYLDDLCLPRSVALRRGADVGDDCTVQQGEEVGCEADDVCRLGYCLAETGMDAGMDGDAADAGPAECTEGGPEDYSPLFSGAADAVVETATSVTLRWLPASDETPRADISYLIFVATTSGGHDLSAPTMTVTGAREFLVEGLTTDTTYYFLVRAGDELGQVECNTNEVSATPASLEGCIDFATRVQPIFDGRCIRCHSGPDAPRDLQLDSYSGVIAGGLTGSTILACQPDSSLLYMKVALDTPPVGSRMPLGGPYLSTWQIATIRLWIEQGARSDPCPLPMEYCEDTTAPTFAGITGATLSGGTGAELCWAEATDDMSAASALEYDIYEATSPGAQSYVAPPRATSAAGATCITIGDLTPGQEYCWVVRARDEASNRDMNTVERCLTVPGA